MCSKTFLTAGSFQIQLPAGFSSTGQAPSIHPSTNSIIDTMAMKLPFLTQFLERLPLGFCSDRSVCATQSPQNDEQSGDIQSNPPGFTLPTIFTTSPRPFAEKNIHALIHVLVKAFTVVSKGSTSFPNATNATKDFSNISLSHLSLSQCNHHGKGQV